MAPPAGSILGAAGIASAATAVSGGSVIRTEFNPAGVDAGPVWRTRHVGPLLLPSLFPERRRVDIAQRHGIVAVMADGSAAAGQGADPRTPPHVVDGSAPPESGRRGKVECFGVELYFGSVLVRVLTMQSVASRHVPSFT
jgi:hypothetical protein